MLILRYILSIFYSSLHTKAHHYVSCANRWGVLVLLGGVLLAELDGGGNNYSLSWTAAFPLLLDVALTGLTVILRRLLPI